MGQQQRPPDGETEKDARFELRIHRDHKKALIAAAERQHPPVSLADFLISAGLEKAGLSGAARAILKPTKPQGKVPGRRRAGARSAA